MVLGVPESQFISSPEINRSRIGIKKSSHIDKDFFQKEINIMYLADIQTDLCNEIYLFFFVQHEQIDTFLSLTPG